MERADRELILEVLKSNVQLRRLYDEHLQLEDRLSSFNSKRFLTPEEQMEQQRLKKQKLSGVDRMMGMLAVRRAA